MNISFIKSAYNESQYPSPDQPEVAFAGRSNVGKSTLINVLVNRKKIARTSSTPGRTQAINFFEVGEKLFFVDLPGYGFARVPLKVKKSWGKMVEGYLKKRTNLMAVVVIMDIRREPTEGDENLIAWLSEYDIPIIPILTKADKLSKQKAELRANVIKKRLANLIPEQAIIFSAKTREGRDRIWEKIEETIKPWSCQARKL